MQRQRGPQHPQQAIDPTAPPPTRPPLRARDARVVDALSDVRATHPYEGGWYNNATFVLPLLGAIGVLIAWAVTGSLELLGLGLFLLAVTGVMLPLVWLTWQRTPTVIVVRDTSLDALHQGRPLQSLPWILVTDVRRVETMGNVRWYVVASRPPDQEDADDHAADHNADASDESTDESAYESARIAIEGEIANVPALLHAARRLAGLPQEPTD